MMEEWKEVPGFERYEISNRGNLRSYCNRHSGRKEKYRLLKGEHDKDGYKRYVLYKDGERSKLFAHRLVCMAFIPNPENKPQVNHLNGIKDDNRVDNLEWVTLCENRQHSYDNDFERQDGEHNAYSKLNEKEVLEMRAAYKLGCFSFNDLADAYNVSSSCVNLIINRKRWNHI